MYWQKALVKHTKCSPIQWVPFIDMRMQALWLSARPPFSLKNLRAVYDKNGKKMVRLTFRRFTQEKSNNGTIFD